MRISTDARTTDIQPAINWISGLIGAAAAAACHRLLVTIPNRLGKSTDELARIAATVAAAAQQRTSASSDVGRVDYMFENVGSWPEPGPGRDHDAIAFFEERFGIKNSN